MHLCFLGDPDISPSDWKNLDSTGAYKSHVPIAVVQTCELRILTALTLDISTTTAMDKHNIDVATAPQTDESDRDYVEERTSQEAKRVVRKIDFWIIPLLFVTYNLNFMVRETLGPGYWTSDSLLFAG